MKTTLLKHLSLVIGLVLVTGFSAFAQVNFTGSYTEDFGGFTGAGFAPTPIAGQLDSDNWRVTGFSDGSGTFGGTNTSGDFARGASTGGESTGGVYSFDVGGGNTASLGVQPGGSDFTPGTITLRIQNNTGNTITDLAIAYDIFYINNATRGNSFNFAYSTDDATYTDVAALDFTSPVASDALGWRSENKTTTITGLSIANGSFVYLQWKGDDVSGSSSRDEFALDNVSVSLSNTELFFSEYIEGSSSNKAIEIYNPTNAAVNLATENYAVELYSNGSASVGNTLNLTGTLAAGDTYVITNAGANGTIDAQSDITSNVTFFNGNDALVLKKNGTIIDVIGQVGNNPGSEWGTGLTSTENNTLRRKCGIVAGDDNPNDAFDPSLEWDGFVSDTFDDLGKHCQIAPNPPIINEFVFNHTGSDPDENEFIEIFGEVSTDYSTYSILVIEGDGASAGNIDKAFSLGTTDANGYWFTPFNASGLGLENGTQTLLLVKGFSGALNDDIDTNNDGNIDNILWATLSDGVAVKDGDATDITYAITLNRNYDGISFTVGGASRVPNGTDTDAVSDWKRNDFGGAGLPSFPAATASLGEGINTPGAANKTALPPAPVINEFVFNHTQNDPDENEFIEVFGNANTDYSGYTILVIEGDGSGGRIDKTFTLGTTDANGYWFTPFNTSGLGLENGTQTLLLVQSFTGSVGDDIDADNDGVIDNSPWVAISDGVAINDGGGSDLTYAITLNRNYDGNSFTVGGASRLPNGTDTDAVSDWTRNDFGGFGLPAFSSVTSGTTGDAKNTPGTANEKILAPTGTVNITESLSAFNTTATGTPSAVQSYQVSGTTLTDDITITVPAASSEFQVSLSAGSGFGNSVTITQASANAGNVTVYVRYLPSSGITHSGSITHESSGAITKTVDVSGVIPPALIDISAARALPEDDIVTIQGVLTVANEFGGPAFIQDATGGIAIFDSQIHGGAYSIGRKLKITAKRVNFQNQIQLSDVTAITDLGAGTLVTPKPIGLNDLGTHRGELVKITNATFPSAGDLLFGNSNYTLTDASGSGAVRILRATDIDGLAQPANCDVIGVVGYFQTTPQLLPRSKAMDLTCATTYTSPANATVNSCISLDKTLEIAAFNIEWFGDEGNSPAGANADVVQLAAVKEIIKQDNADIYTLVEIVDTTLMRTLVNQLSAETPDTWDVVLSDFTSGSGANPQRVGFLYKSNIITRKFTYGLLQEVHPKYNGNNATALSAAAPNFPTGFPDADKSRFWASGRLPFWMRAEVTLNGSTEEIDFIAIHGRANNSGDPQGRYDMRRYDVTVLEDSIRNNSMLTGKKIIIAGDYNDDVDVTVADISSTLTSFDAYTSRPGEYTILSKALSIAGRRSYVSRENMIDHIAVSNELAPSYIPNSVNVGYQYYDEDYADEVSDHFMVSARLEIVPIAPCSFTATAITATEVKLDWTDNSNIEANYIVEVSPNGTSGWTAVTGSPFASGSTTTTLTGLTANSPYYFRVRAEESATNVSPWNITSINVSPSTGGNTGGSSSVSTPTGFEANSISPTQINLSWNTVNGATAYRLFRNGELLATIPAGANLYEDGSTEENTFYTYRLVAVGQNETSTPASLSVRSLPAAPELIEVGTACERNSTFFSVRSSGSVYRVYADSTDLTPLFETNNARIATPALSSTTTYFVSVVTAQQESKRTRVEIQVNPIPEAVILEEGDIISCDASANLTVKLVEGAVYSLLKNGNEMASSQSNIFEISATGSYQVRVSLNGCSAISETKRVVLNFSPVAEILQGEIARSCGNDIVLSASQTNNNATYVWSREGIDVGEGTEVRVNESGVYTLTVTENTCISTDEIKVEITRINPDIQLSATALTFCPEEEVILTIDNPETDVVYAWYRNGRLLRNTDGLNSLTTSIQGKYKVEARQNGCTLFSETILIDRLVVSVTYLRTDDNSLSVEPVEGQIAKITWLKDGGEASEFANQERIEPQESGYYSVIVEYITGCEFQTRTVFFRVNEETITGEEEIIETETVVYPNPSSGGYFRLQLSSQINSEVIISVTDNIGRNIKNMIITTDQLSENQILDLSKLPKGLYSVTITFERRTITKKVVIN